MVNWQVIGQLLAASLILLSGPAMSTDIDGDTEQSVISYEMTFGSFVRTIS